MSDISQIPPIPPVGLTQPTRDNPDGLKVSREWWRWFHRVFTISKNQQTIIDSDALTLTASLLSAPFSAITSLTRDVTGILPIANGGTNASAAGTALDNIGPFASNGILERTGAATYGVLADPLIVGHGGTGIASGTSGAVPYFSGASSIASSALLAAGQVVTGGGAATAPATIANGQLPATATNDNAAAGKVGEYKSSIVLIANEVSMTSTVAVNIVTLSLTAGDWDVDGELWLDTNVLTTVSLVKAAITQTTGTIPTVPADVTGVVAAYPASLAGEDPIVAVGTIRAPLSGTTDIFLVGQTTFATSTCAGYGKLRARRIR